MTVFKQAIIELVLLTVASVSVALAANQIRDKGYIQPTKSYFAKGPTQHEATTPHSKASSDGAEKAKPSVQAHDPKTESITKVPSKKLDHRYQTVTVDEAHEILDDPGTEQGLNVFVDAREEEDYAEGHIPGAIQCFPYEVHKCLDRVTSAAQGAEKVIVYCGGGDCEDSILMCRELVEAGVPEEAIYLFEGGWKEWSAKGLHTESGAP